MTQSSLPGGADPVTVPADLLQAHVEAVLSAAGACPESARDATRAMMHASLHGIDSHGVRLTEHYCRVLRSGRVKGRPQVKVDITGPGSAMVDADDGLGHHATYKAMDTAVALARQCGVGAVGVVRSSHNGAAGTYALAGAEQGCIALATTNADAIVNLHSGAAPFHGTNPLALAAPVAGERPWLLDMATSSIPKNRVLLYRALGTQLPADVAADAAGRPTTEAAMAAMLLPLGGALFGFKGAGLAGIATILSAALTGASLDHEMRPMFENLDSGEPRNLGHFCLALDPDRFAGRQAFEAAMQRYLLALRASAATPGETVMAPGDREWRVADARRRLGIPVDPEAARFLAL